MRSLAIGMALFAIPWMASGQEASNGRTASRKVEVPGVRPTQLAVVYDTDREEIRFRATVLARYEDALILLTAAHCLAPDDVGGTLKLSQGESSMEAGIEFVARNPAYGTAPAGVEVPGADNAVARVRVKRPDGVDPDLLGALRPGVLSMSQVPPADGEIVPIYAVDQFEQAQTVRAGNFSNPKWLEWGAGYRPIPGDSGSGVFVYRRRDGGHPEPVLIGVVTDRSSQGGGASVVCLRHAWLAEALRAARPAAPKP